MIEAKLYQAAQELPLPTSTFSLIEEKAHQSKRNTHFCIRQYRRAAAILACVFLLMGGAVIAATTEVAYSAWASSSNSFQDAASAAEKVGIVLPEAFGDSPFYNITTMHVIPEGTSYLEAICTPTYRWYAVDYGIQEVVRQYDSDDPDSGFSETTVIRDEFSLSIGSTDGELWDYVFSLDESGVWSLDDTLNGSFRTEEYNGMTLQIGTTVSYDWEYAGRIYGYHHRVIWVDTYRHAVFSLSQFTPTGQNADQLPGEMLEFAKEIIDLNLPES